MTTIRTNHGEFTGQTVETIVRRVYGRRARALRSADPNSPQWGEVITPRATGGAWIDATIIWVEED